MIQKRGVFLLGQLKQHSEIIATTQYGSLSLLAETASPYWIQRITIPCSTKKKKQKKMMDGKPN